jgi:glutathione S-transferase
MTTIKLYDADFPGTRGSRTRWMLEELGIPYERAAIKASQGEHRKAPYAPDIHPHGLVPAAEIDGTVLIESAGICMQLSDMHPEKNLGAEVGSLERARWYQWITYAAATLDEPSAGS